MRRLTEKEKKLLLVLLASVFILGNLFGLSFLFRKRTALRSDLFALHARELESRSWLADRELWMQRKKWLEANQPRFKTSGDANASLLGTVQTTAGIHHVSILEQGFSEPATNSFFNEVGMRLRVNGSLENILRWLAEIQQPEKLQALLSLSLKSAAEPPNMICELQIVCWYIPSTPP